MTAERIQFWSTVAQTILSFAALLASVTIPLAIYYGQRRQARLEYIRTMRDTWIAIDTATIGDPRLMKLADEINDPSSQNLSDDERTKKWFGYMFMNIFFADYLGHQYKLHRRDAMTHVRAGLRNLLQHDLICSIVRAYPPDFRKLCHEIMEEIYKERQNQNDIEGACPNADTL